MWGKHGLHYLGSMKEEGIPDSTLQISVIKAYWYVSMKEKVSDPGCRLHVIPREFDRISSFDPQKGQKYNQPKDHYLGWLLKNKVINLV